MSDKSSGLRAWSDRWSSLFSIVFGIIGIPGLLIAGFGLWLQYDQLVEAERDTARQFKLLRDTVGQLRDQTEIEVTVNTKAASDRFFELRDDPMYEEFFSAMEKIDFSSLTDEEEKDLEKSLVAEGQHFQSTWVEVLNCDEPHCKLFDMLHKFNVRDICSVAASDARRMRAVIEGMPDVQKQDEAYSRIRRTPIGHVMCSCPDDWTSWGVETSPYCIDFERKN